MFETIPTYAHSDFSISGHPSLDSRVKRWMDLFVSLFILLLSAPIWGLAIVVLLISSPGPIIFRHKRIGLNGNPFYVYKLRTMHLDAEHRLNALLESNQKAKAEWVETQKLKNDPRIIPFGSIIRKFSIDELPQLMNIVRGDMSLVGPRPIVNDEISRYADDFAYYRSVRPGLTGLWQVSGRNLTTYEERVAFDVQYVKNWSPMLDWKIIFKTIKTVITGYGAF